MKLKLVVSAILLVCIWKAQYISNNVIEPQVATSMALEQFKNPSVQMNSKMRLYNNLNVWGGLYAGWLVVTVAMLYPNVKSMFTETKKEETV
jgi:hypothetical protein